MTKLIDTINNLLKLVTSLATLAVLGAVIYFGLRAYHAVAELTSKPIQMPTVNLPEIKLPPIEIPPVKVAMPEITLPEVKLPELFGKKEVPKDGQWRDGDGNVVDFKRRGPKPWGEVMR